MYNDDEQNADEAENMQRIKLKVENTIRWRFKDGQDDPSIPSIEREKESNARFVRWNDGSLSLVLGDEMFQVNTQSLQNQHQFLVVHHPSELVLQTQQGLTDNMTFQPQSTQSLTHRKLTAAIAGKHVKGVKTVMVATLSDPKAAKEAIEQRELEQVRSRRKVAAERTRHARVTGLTASGLEESDGEHDEDDEDFEAEEERKREKIMVSNRVLFASTHKAILAKNSCIYPPQTTSYPLPSPSKSQDRTITSPRDVIPVMKRTAWTKRTITIDVIAIDGTGAEIVAVIVVKNDTADAAPAVAVVEPGAGPEVAPAAVLEALHTGVAMVIANVDVDMDVSAATAGAQAAARVEAEPVALQARGTSDALEMNVIGMWMLMPRICVVGAEHLIMRFATRMMKSKPFKDAPRSEERLWIAMKRNRSTNL